MTENTEHKEQINIEHEILRNGFEKFHIKGLPFDAVIHKITQADIDGLAHDHPFNFTSFILKGGYIEKLWFENYSSRMIARMPNTSHYVPATQIHEIVKILDGECWTLIIPEKWEREPCLWKFENNNIYRRQWNEPDFELVTFK